ncbi:uncharacterized protein DSM5745_04896 [Aspergillus mulundensis]|uniref:Uncharacterized protein n=1 Tax=Aspergillus mulundensis TaxID=1810919 RepID=A0A3D8S4X5_9EURO|nr:Uncharacterized protein DSM5745_04896 [Aspergillus mulundensis]RDW81339.1 Uncharacterized protein DSM5745_04896 [Aspergillus mulundensis]
MSLFRQCRTATVQLRGFSSSSALRVGPESPNFIEVPRTIQPDLPPKPRVKGTLPVPRELFPKRRVDKPNPQYIAAAAPLPTKQENIDPNEPHAEYRSWKRSMADMRRQNFEEGLLELHNRQQRTDKTMEERSRARQKLRDHVLRQPDREDELLTRPTIPKAMLPKRTPVLPGGGRDRRLKASQRRTERKAQLKASERRESLHTLYMNAREFITTETQLAAEIEKIFPEGENEAWRSDKSKNGENIWNRGFPKTMASRLGESHGEAARESERWDVVQGRIKKLGEEITGGKI